MMTAQQPTDSVSVPGFPTVLALVLFVTTLSLGVPAGADEGTSVVIGEEDYEYLNESPMTNSSEERAFYLSGYINRSKNTTTYSVTDVDRDEDADAEVGGLRPSPADDFREIGLGDRKQLIGMVHTHPGEGEHLRRLSRMDIFLWGRGIGGKNIELMGVLTRDGLYLYRYPEINDPLKVVMEGEEGSLVIDGGGHPGETRGEAYESLEREIGEEVDKLYRGSPKPIEAGKGSGDAEEGRFSLKGLAASLSLDW